MKSIAIAMSLVFSISAFAKTPASVAINKLIASGSYIGTNSSGDCRVNVSTSSDAAVISIEAGNTYLTFALIDSSLNYNVNEVTGELAASQKTNYPHYTHGGSKYLNVKARDLNVVDFYISQTSLDHRGEDHSSFAACSISL